MEVTSPFHIFDDDCKASGSRIRTPGSGPGVKIQDQASGSRMRIQDQASGSRMRTRDQASGSRMRTRDQASGSRIRTRGQYSGPSVGVGRRDRQDRGLGATWPTGSRQCRAGRTCRELGFEPWTRSIRGSTGSPQQRANTEPKVGVSIISPRLFIISSVSNTCQIGKPGGREAPATLGGNGGRRLGNAPRAQPHARAQSPGISGHLRAAPV